MSPEAEMRRELETARAELATAREEKRLEEANRWHQVTTKLETMSTQLAEIKALTSQQAVEQQILKGQTAAISLLLTGPQSSPELGLIVRQRETEHRVDNLELLQKEVSQKVAQSQNKLKDMSLTTAISLGTGVFLLWLKTKFLP